MTLRLKMTERFTCSLPQLASDSDPADQVVAILSGHGLRRADAQRLVENELTITPITGIKKLTELLDGRAGDDGKWIEASEECKVAAGKLVAFLRWDGTSRLKPKALTETERELVIEHGFDVAVREGFFQRVTDYVESPEQLAAVFKLISPTVGGGNRTPDKTRRLIDAAAELLGTKADGTESEYAACIGSDASLKQSTE